MTSTADIETKGRAIVAAAQVEAESPCAESAPTRPSAAGRLIENMLDISHHYDGQLHYSKAKTFRNPTTSAASDPGGLPAAEKVRHRDALGRVTERPRDLARYISPTYAKPFRLLVQATPQAYQGIQGEWRRVPLKGNGPTLLRLCVWAVGDKRERPKDPAAIAVMIGKMILISPLQGIILLFGFSRQPPVGAMYPRFLCRSWDYPKYPRNPLDACPISQRMVTWAPLGENGGPEPEQAEYLVVGNQDRLLRPRKLVILKGDKWDLSDGTNQPYIVVSYTARHFIRTDTGPDGKKIEKRDPSLEQMAQRLAQEAGCEAYWIDHRCRAAEQPQLTDDVHRICDVFRGARQVCVVLPSLSVESKRLWGSRMWCLPEALLSRSHKIKFYSPGGSTEEITKIELAGEVWTDGNTLRPLAEHYSGLITLSRLELIYFGLKALTERTPENPWTQGDVAYALMSLLNYRPRMNPEDDLFQALGRLSLANDSDRIIERMVCMLPDAYKRHPSPFVLEDVLGANLWDIEPLCQVAGVGHGHDIILDGCQAASIRWKDIPAIGLYGRRTWKRGFVRHVLRTVPIIWLMGFILMVITSMISSVAGSSSSASYGYSGYHGRKRSTYSQPDNGMESKPSESSSGGTDGLVAAGVLIFLLGQGLIFASNWWIQTVYGGKVWGATPALVGFEGTLPLHMVERKVFGNAIGRLQYAPSSGKLCEREVEERIGKGPAWIEQPGVPGHHAPELPAGHKLFTLIDTGPSMAVHVFHAARPPSVALICGKEGGMLRVALCSYERSTNCLHKETVLRMETPMLSLTTLHGWLKLA